MIDWFIAPPPQQPKYCQRLASLTDLTNRLTKDVTVCGRDVTGSASLGPAPLGSASPRVVHLMTSQSASVRLALFGGSADNPLYFFVHYEGWVSVENFLIN